MQGILVARREPCKRLELPALTAKYVNALAELYRTTHNVRLRTRAQMVLLAVEQQLGVREIAAIVRECEGTVRCWLKRYTRARARWTAGSVGGWSADQGHPSLSGPVAAAGAAATTQPGPTLFDLDPATAGG